METEGGVQMYGTIFIQGNAFFLGVYFGMKKCKIKARLNIRGDLMVS